VLGPNTDPLVAIDGKTLKHSGVHLAGAINLPSHRWLGVEPVAEQSNEIPAAQKRIARAPILPGQMVSWDALHTQHKTVAQILYDKGADYLWPIKGNQSGLLETAQHLLPERVSPSGGPGGRQSQPGGSAARWRPARLNRSSWAWPGRRKSAVCTGKVAGRPSPKWHTWSPAASPGNSRPGNF
jgi:hypothetical protein